MQKTNAFGSWPRRAGVVFCVLALLPASTTISLSAPQAGHFRYDRARTGRTNFAAPTKPQFAWNYATGSSCAATPVVAADGTVYFGAVDKYLYAVTKDGALAWRYRANSSITGSAAIGADGSVYFTTLSGKLYAVDPSGVKKWENPFNFGSVGAAGPVLIGGDGVIYFGADNGNVYAVKPDGTLAWNCATGGALKNGLSMSADGTTLYAPSNDGRVYAMSTNGALRWTSSIVTASTGCVVGPDGSVYVGGSDGRFYAMNANGSIRWSFRTDARITSAPALGLDGVLYFGSMDANLYAVNPNGALKWSQRSTAPIYSAPTLDATGLVLYGSMSGNVLAVRSTDGSVAWTRAAGSSIYTSPVVGFDSPLGTVYVLDNSGVLTKFTGPAIAPAVPEPASLLTLAFAITAALGAIRKRRFR